VDELLKISLCGIAGSLLFLATLLVAMVLPLVAIVFWFLVTVFFTALVVRDIVKNGLDFNQ